MNGQCAKHKSRRARSIGAGLPSVAILVAGVALPARAAPQQWTPETLHAFNGKDGDFPTGALVATRPDRFYGVTVDGGATNDGTVFRIDTDKFFKKVYDFKGGKDGKAPTGGLLAKVPYLYGVTAVGGDHDLGTVFRIDINDGSKFTLHAFKGRDASDGSTPQGVLIEVDRRLFGTTHAGGKYGFGTVYYVDPRNCKGEGTCAEEVIYSFKGIQHDEFDGKYPGAGLVYDGRRLVGTTSSGGAFNKGTVFAVNTRRSEIDDVLHSFQGPQQGSAPESAVLFTNGEFFGTTESSGNAKCLLELGCGTVFAVEDNNDVPKKFVRIHQFEGRPDDGAHSVAPLIRVGKELYGTTRNDGGPEGADHGAVFEVAIVGGKSEIIYPFPGEKGGAKPYSGLKSEGGKLYGMTARGGNMAACGDGCGTVFELSPPAAGEPR